MPGISRVVRAAGPDVMFSFPTSFACPFPYTLVLEPERRLHHMGMLDFPYGAGRTPPRGDHAIMLWIGPIWLAIRIEFPEI